jgi:hypothetical protein
MSEHQQIQQSKKPDSTFQKQSILTSQMHVSHPASIIQRARINPKSLTAADVLQLQRTIGNRAVGRLLSEIRNPSKVQQVPIQRQEIPEEEKEPLQGMFGKEPEEETCPSCVQRQEKPEDEEPIQGKFETIQRLEPEDEEKLQMKSVVQRQDISEEEEPLQGKFETIQRQEIPEEEPLQKKSENNTGMPDNLKAGVESLSGIDMSDVRVHYNSSKPAEVGALAYTHGQDIYVATGQEKHLAHEGWHVVQQAQGRVQPTMQMKDGIQVNDDEELEHEADLMGTKALQTRCLDQIAIGLSTEGTKVEQRQAEQMKSMEISDQGIMVSGEKVHLNFLSTLSANSMMQPNVDSMSVQKKRKQHHTIQTIAQNTGNIPIQCKGVKPQLLEANANIETLARESNKSLDLMNTVGDAIYEAYKPAKIGQVPLSRSGWDAKNRDKSKGRISEQDALDGTTRINHWASTANDSATRILQELTAIADVVNVDLASIKMGIDTDTEPDAAALTQTGSQIALESKRVDSPKQGAVDGHIVAASKQLQKRDEYQTKKITKTNFKTFFAYIHILNSENTWPYTPTTYAKSAPNFYDISSVMTDRLKKYKSQSKATISITYVVTLPDRSKWTTVI